MARALPFYMHVHCICWAGCRTITIWHLLWKEKWSMPTKVHFSSCSMAFVVEVCPTNIQVPLLHLTPLAACRKFLASLWEASFPWQHNLWEKLHRGSWCMVCVVRRAAILAGLKGPAFIVKNSWWIWRTFLRFLLSGVGSDRIFIMELHKQVEPGSSPDGCESLLVPEGTNFEPQ